MSKNLKYELYNKSVLAGEKTLYRIKALKSFSNVKKGDLGGLIEKESNLSQEGNCWVYRNAKVYDDAWVSGNAHVSDNAVVHGNAKVFNNAQVYGNAVVYDSAWIYNDAQVFGNAQIYGDAIVSGNAVIYDNAKVFGNAHVFDNAVVYGDAWAVSPFCFCLSKHQISFCSYSDLKIGCLVHTIEEWKQLGEDIGKENGYSDTEIALYRKTVLLAEEYIELAKKEANNGRTREMGA